MNQAVSALATSGPGGLVGAVVGWVVFDAFATTPPCTDFPCPSADPALLGMTGVPFVMTLAAIGAGIGWLALLLRE